MKKHYRIRYHGRIVFSVYALTMSEAKSCAIRLLKTDGWRVNPASLDVR